MSNMFDLLAATIGSLAWPIVFLTVTFLFRHEIRTTFRILRMVKYGDLEIQFSESLDLALDTFEEGGIEITRMSNDVSDDVHGVDAILQSWADLEAAIRALNSNLNGTEKRRIRSIVDQLNKMNVISTDQKLAIDQLYSLRNIAVHLDNSKLNSGQIAQFSRMAEGLRNAILLESQNQSVAKLDLGANTP